MYKIVKVKDKVRIPPQRFGKDLDQAILDLTREQYEGIIDEDVGIVIAVISTKKTGHGHVVLGDGAAYYETEADMLVYKPSMHELVEGIVNETTEFGAFVSVGPMEGLVHVSQMMDEYIDYDSKNNSFIGKETKRSLGKEDSVFARVVTISLKSTIADSKIGLTMRQPFLGKKEWVETEIKELKEGKEKPKKGKETRKIEEKPEKKKEAKEKKR